MSGWIKETVQDLLVTPLFKMVYVTIKQVNSHLFKI